MAFDKTWLNWRKVVLSDRDLSFYAKSIALYLNTFMNDSHDFAFPSIETIRAGMSIGSNTTVIKYLTELVEKGWLIKEKRYGKSAIYYAKVPENILSITPPVVVHEVNSSITRGGLTVLHEVEPNKQGNNQLIKQEEKSSILFDDFWELYPRKESKSAASKNWLKLTPDEQSKAITDCQKRYEQSERKYIPHASTYLNGKRWEDEIYVVEETEAYGKGGI